MPDEQVVRRVWASVPPGTREALAALSDGDLRSLLLSLADQRAARVTPADLVRRWTHDRFVRPAAVDPRACAAAEGRLWEMLPEQVVGVELAPVVPLGTSSALAPVSQDKVVATTRLTEVVSDSTNALAIEAAVRRRGRTEPAEVHLAASHRQLRAQQFGPGLPAHFRLFALVSSARDTGSAGTEASLLVQHLRYWRSVLAVLAPDATPLVQVAAFQPAFGDRVTDTLLPALAEQRLPVPVPVLKDDGRQRGRGYYTAGAVRLIVHADGREVELGDGGFTDWTAQLLGDAKERCLVSCLSIDGIARLRRA